ncbi:MAG: DUF1549 domain-containing protein [Pirellulaceae bacterium]|nr:DUF1549 domain-containing protein [Pirellulaceae bacterium]
MMSFVLDAQMFLRRRLIHLGNIFGACLFLLGSMPLQSAPAADRAVEKSTTTSVATDRPLTFENDIIPILTRYGCNTSGCHGKAEGQNGFKLSVFGFDPQADHLAITAEARGRRIFPAMPEQSLFLQKASGGLPHGGGVRLTPDRPEYETLRRWIGSGVPLGSASDPRIVSIRLHPQSAQLGMKQTQQLQVVATFTDGYQKDVTDLATFQSNNEGLARVDEHGLVTIGSAPGDVAIMTSYLGSVDVFRALVPGQEATTLGVDMVDANVIDQFVHAKLRQLKLQPSAAADDATYMRRVYLDIIGTLPTAGEARQFLSDTNPNRRAEVVERLFKRPEYADYWGLKWSDLLRVNRLQLGRKHAYMYYQWIRDSFAENKHLDQFAQDLLTAEGPVHEQPATLFYKAVPDPKQMASTLSQALLGVRIECAQCHHHPYDRWGQDDYYGMQAFFNDVAFKTSSQGELLVRTGSGKSIHPRTQKEVAPRALGQTIDTQAQNGLAPNEVAQVNKSHAGTKPGQGWRRELSRWMTDKQNPYFARNMANRIWAHVMGRGLIEPVDDVRMTNPPTNPELLDALANHLIESNFDQQALIRLITSSNTYQRDCQPNVQNQNDHQNYSRYPLTPMGAEVLYDAVCQTTGVSEKFAGIPEGSRAIQLWDSQVPHYFLQLFGRPMRATACECERVAEPTVSQVLHVLNSPEIQSKLAHDGGQLSKLIELPDDQLMEELSLTFFSRFPTLDEKRIGIDYLQQAKDRRRGLEDLAWGMMNSLEFLFKH